MRRTSYLPRVPLKLSSLMCSSFPVCLYTYAILLCYEKTIFVLKKNYICLYFSWLVEQLSIAEVSIKLDGCHPYSITFKFLSFGFIIPSYPTQFMIKLAYSLNFLCIISDLNFLCCTLSCVSFL